MLEEVVETLSPEGRTKYKARVDWEREMRVDQVEKSDLMDRQFELMKGMRMGYESYE